MAIYMHRRNTSRWTLARFVGGFKRTQRDLAEQRERLVTQQEITELRLAR